MAKAKRPISYALVNKIREFWKNHPKAHDFFMPTLDVKKSAVGLHEIVSDMKNGYPPCR